MDPIKAMRGNLVTITKMCPCCGKKFDVQITEQEEQSLNNGGAVPNVLDGYDIFVREAFISGFCPDCISKTFNTPKPGESWGEMMTCPNCESENYDKDFNKKIGKYRCHSCGFPFTKEESENPDLIDWSKYAEDEE